jgi:hypothetical protein
MTGPTAAELEPPRGIARRTLLVGLGLVLVLGVVAIGVEVGRYAPRPRVPTAPLPAHTYLAEVPSFAAVSRDGRTLSVFPVTGPCGEPVRQRLLAVESDDRVSLTLLVHGRKYTDAQRRHMICAAVAIYPGPPPSITLRAPLGTREAVQGLTGRRIPVYGGAQVATPRVLPKGCAPGPVQPSGDILTSGPPYPSGSHPGLTWSCDVTVPFPPRYPRTPASTLDFGQWQGWVRSMGLPIEERTAVQGHPALVKVERVGAVNIIQVRSISWREDGQTFVITSASGLSQTVAHSRAVLSAAALVRIAEGLQVSNARTPAGDDPHL